METVATDLSPLVSKYVQLRDRKAAMKKAFDDSVAEIDAMLDKVENFLLKQMNAQGAESIKTQSGTAYISKKTNVSIKDLPAFRAFLREQSDPFVFLDNKANKTAIEEYTKEHKDLPPGIGWSEHRAVNIKRS